MSHVALRRVVIRMLHDPIFAEAVHADAGAALAGVDVSAEERGWLVATPPAAWRTDPARPARVLAALAEEFPASLAALGDDGRRFFAAPEFHAAVQERGSLAAAFGAWLGRTGGAAVRAVAAVERAVAAVRRAPRRPAPSPPGTLRLAPHAARVDPPTGTAARLARGGDRPARGLGPGREALLVVRDPASGAVEIEELSPELAEILDAAAGPVARAVLVDVARRRGAGLDEARAVVDDLAAAGVLI